MDLGIGVSRGTGSAGSAILPEPEIPGLICRLDATTLGDAGTDFGVWANRVVGAPDAVQTDVTVQPTVALRGDRKIARWRSSGAQWMRFNNGTAPFLGSTFSVFFVASFAGVANQQTILGQILDTGVGKECAAVQTDAEPTQLNYADPAVYTSRIPPAIAAGDLVVAAFCVDEALRKYDAYAGGVQVRDNMNLNAPANAVATGENFLGTRNPTVTYPERHRGDIGDLAIYNRRVTKTEALDLMAYFKSKWGL